MTFDPKESISFNGNTGPYLQYTGRPDLQHAAQVRGAEGSATRPGRIDPLRCSPSPRSGRSPSPSALFPEIVAAAARELNPSVLTAYLFELCKALQPLLPGPPGAPQRGPGPRRVADRPGQGGAPGACGTAWSCWGSRSWRQCKGVGQAEVAARGHVAQPKVAGDKVGRQVETGMPCRPVPRSTAPPRSGRHTVRPAPHPPGETRP